MTLIIRNDNYEWLSDRVYYSVVESQKYFNTKFLLNIQFIANHKINCLKRIIRFLLQRTCAVRKYLHKNLSPPCVIFPSMPMATVDTTN